MRFVEIAANLWARANFDMHVVALRLIVCAAGFERIALRLAAIARHRFAAQRCAAAVPGRSHHTVVVDVQFVNPIARICEFHDKFIVSVQVRFTSERRIVLLVFQPIESQNIV